MWLWGWICTMVAVSNDLNFLYPQFLFQIKDELNNPTNELLKNFKSHGGHWECCTSDVAGYMFRVWQIHLEANFDLLMRKLDGTQDLFSEAPCDSFHSTTISNLFFK